MSIGPLYHVEKRTKGDASKGRVHGAYNESRTICGKVISNGSVLWPDPVARPAMTCRLCTDHIEPSERGAL